jgi:outer membrane lipoprotein carrier protein
MAEGCRATAVTAAAIVLLLCGACGDAGNASDDRAKGDAVRDSLQRDVPAVVQRSDSVSASADDSADMIASPADVAAPARTQSGEPGATADADSGTDDQGDAGARALKRAAAEYADIRSMTASFTMVTSNPLLRSSAESAGKLYQQRPDRVALHFTKPAGDAIVSDGEYFWVYMPATYNDQVFRTPAAQAGSQAVDLQAQFVGNPLERFTYRNLGEEVVAGHAADVLLLTPRKPAQYRTLKVWIDQDDALVRRFEITEQSGVTRRIELSGLRTNVAIPSSVFHFTPPAGVRVVEQGAS